MEYKLYLNWDLVAWIDAGSKTSIERKVARSQVVVNLRNRPYLIVHNNFGLILCKR